MEKKIRKDSMLIWMLKSLLAAYFVTGILLLLLTLAVYKLELGERIVSAGIIGIYVAANLIGGIIIGKLAGKRRFLWGLILGVTYFALLLLITLGVYRTVHGNAVGIMTTFLLCAGSGMFGGMIS